MGGGTSLLRADLRVCRRMQTFQAFATPPRTGRDQHWSHKALVQTVSTVPTSGVLRKEQIPSVNNRCINSITCSAERFSLLSHASCISFPCPSGGSPPGKYSCDSSFSCDNRATETTTQMHTTEQQQGEPTAHAHETQETIKGHRGTSDSRSSSVLYTSSQRQEGIFSKKQVAGNAQQKIKSHGHK